jgi:transcriptional regulator with XRE-family HTH domain
VTESNVIEQIEAIRKSKGITKTHVAKQCGHSVNWYWKLENGRLRLRVDELGCIAKALDVDPSIFFANDLAIRRVEVEGNEAAI